MKASAWTKKLQPYAKHNSYKSFLYLATSIVPYLILISIMFLLLVKGYPYWIVLIVSVLSVGFYVRTFMILHDCSHGSFLKPRANTILGHICGVLTFTPFYDWQRSHGLHHANVSNLDKRGYGDVWTMTLNEYVQSTKGKRLAYRFFRNPLFLFLFAPILLFLLMYRLPQKSTNRKGYFSIIITNVILITIIVIAYFTVGIKNYIIVQLPILFAGTSIGMWLFYVQHQFENVYWAHQKNWSLVDAAMKGSSFYKLPRIMQWFAGNIGYHNIHHLNARIPCYNLSKCYAEVPELHNTIPIKLLSSLKSLRLHLWDEATGKLISFKYARYEIKLKHDNHSLAFSGK